MQRMSNKVNWDGELSGTRDKILELWDEFKRVVDSTDMDVNAAMSTGVVVSMARARKGLQLLQGRIRQLKSDLLSVKKVVIERRKAEKALAKTSK